MTRRYEIDIEARVIITAVVSAKSQSAAEQKAKRLLAGAVDSLDSEPGFDLVVSEIRHPLPLWANLDEDGGTP